MTTRPGLSLAEGLELAGLFYPLLQPIIVKGKTQPGCNEPMQPNFRYNRQSAVGSQGSGNTNVGTVRPINYQLLTPEIS